MSQTIGSPPGGCTIVPAPLSSTTAPNRSAAARAASSRWASTHVDSRPSRRASSPACGVSTVGCDRSTGSRPKSASASTTTGSSSRSSRRATSACTSALRPQPRPEGDSARSLRLGQDLLLGVVPVEAALDRLERQRLDNGQALPRHGERDVAGIRAERGQRA